MTPDPWRPAPADPLRARYACSSNGCPLAGKCDRAMWRYPVRCAVLGHRGPGTALAKPPPIQRKRAARDERGPAP